VVAQLYNAEPLARVVLLDGHTGSGKTEVLHRLAARGVQTLDLEALAAHRGSLFGELPDLAQPSQKLFESRLLAGIEALDGSRPVVVEAESSKIGRLMLPPVLWQAMSQAARIELTAPLEARALYLAGAYADVAADPARLEAALVRLPDRPGRKQLEAWTALARARGFAALAAALIEAHYDPAYRRSSRKHGRAAVASVAVDLEGDGFDRAASAVAEVLAAELAPSPADPGKSADLRQSVKPTDGRP
jgi:tRNA 2-selenouridine synthase